MSRSPLARNVMLPALLLTLGCAWVAWSAGPASAADAKAPANQLVITKAFYGDLPDGPKTDVTAKLTAMIKDNKLTVEATNDNFGDPAENVAKKLKVEYTANGVAGEKTVAETETLTLNGKPSKLVIRKAFYGDLPDGAKVDVSGKVAAKVDGDSLSIDATNDNFTDPADGVVKKLTVDYTFEGKDKTKTVDENGTLTISDKGE